IDFRGPLLKSWRKRPWKIKNNLRKRIKENNRNLTHENSNDGKESIFEEKDCKISSSGHSNHQLKSAACLSRELQEFHSESGKVGHFGWRSGPSFWSDGAGMALRG